MLSPKKTAIQECVERLTGLIHDMDDRDELYDDEGGLLSDAATLVGVRDSLQQIASDTAPEARVLVTVCGGVADYVFEGPVAVEVFDHDNYQDDPEETGLPSSESEQLARQIDSIAAYYAERDAQASVDGGAA